MDKKENENNYREERKQRLAKAAKKQNKKKGDSTDVIVGIVKALAIVVVIGIVLGALYVYGVPQSILPALKVGDRTYTMSEYSYYYSSTFQTYANTAYSSQSQYGFNLSGFDYTISPADQTKKDDDGNDITWDQFFRDSVVDTLENYNYYLGLAKEQGVTLSEENQKQIDSDIEEIAKSAESNSFSTSRYISYMFGKGLNEKKLRALLADQYLVAQMVELQEDELKKDVTMEDIEAVYNEDPSDYLSVDIRLLGIAIEDEDKAEETTAETTTEAEATEAESTEAEATEAEATEAEATEAEATEAEETAAADDTTASDETTETAEEEPSEPSEAELIANEMLSKVTDEDSFIELCKEYCAADQKATFEDPSASLAIGIKKSTVAQNIDEDLAEWLFSDEREVGDKTVCAAKDYVYVIMIKNTAYREETPLASARHILISYSDIAAELAAEKAAEETTTEATAPTETAEEPTEATAEETTAANEETTAANEETTAAAIDTEEVLTASDGKEIRSEGDKYSAEVVLKTYEKALEIYNEYLNGEKTEDAFAALADQYSSDTASTSKGENSKTTGGLYEDIAKGQMVAPFENWVYDEARQPGDVGLVQTSYGWHVMYYVSSHEDAQWVETIRDKIVSDKQKEYEESIADQIKGAASTTALTKFAGDNALHTIENLYGL